MNKIEKYKQEKDGLDILHDIPRYAQEGWEAITDGDKERLKWAGIFFRRQTPSHFMVRLRMWNGLSNAAQFRTIADMSDEFGKGFADLTTRHLKEIDGEDVKGFNLSADKDMRGKKKTDHVGIFRQKQHGLSYVGLAVPAGRITTTQLRGVVDLAERYGNGEIRLTPGQNVIIRDVPDAKIGNLTQEPLLQELRYDPSEIMRSLISCTGIDYCHFSLIETKQRALEAVRYLQKWGPIKKPLRLCFS